MKKIVIIVAFIFVGALHGMEKSSLDDNNMQRSLLGGNDRRQYVYNAEKIAYLKDIQNLYHCTQQEDVQSRTQEEIQSEGPTRGQRLEEIFSFLKPIFFDYIQPEDVRSCIQEELQSQVRTSGPGIEEIFSFLAPVQKHDVSHVDQQIDQLILGFLQEASGESVEEQQKECNEKSNSKKRTFVQATSSNEKDRDLSHEPVVSNTSKRAARKSPEVSENGEICGMNGCSFHTVLSDTMKNHKEAPHEQKQCPYPVCAFHYQSKGEWLQHIKENHPENYCTVCGYSSKLRSNFLRHLKRGKHHAPKNPAFINFKLG
jgi:DNA-directed RNA polymerase subunit M/transcription elongation factor TFIIS